MSFFTNVGPLTWIAPGETHYWSYSWPDGADHGLQIAGPNLDRNGSFGPELIAFDQGKQLELESLDADTGTNYFVSIRNTGFEDNNSCLYNLQVGGFQ